MRKKPASPKKIKKQPFSFKNFIFLSLSLIALLVFSNKLIGKNSHKEEPCANSISCIKDLSGKFQDTKEGVFNDKIVYVPDDLRDEKEKKAVLGEESGKKKHIYIDLSAQKLYAVEDGKLKYEFLVSTGKWYPTPTGTFNIWIKLRYTRMTGGNPAFGTYYDLPNVPYTMYFYNNEIVKSRGFGLHGAYWHNNFGHPMSHGCVNMKPEEAKIIFDWVDPPTTGSTTYAKTQDDGTPITIYGITPKE